MMSSLIDNIEASSLPSGGDCQIFTDTRECEPKLKLLKPGEDFSFPLKTSTHVYNQELQAEAADVDVIITHFEDKIQIIVTDISKPGSIFHIARDKPKNPQSFNANNKSDFIYSVDLLFGAESPELLTTARYLGQVLNQEKPILLTLGFKNPKNQLKNAVVLESKKSVFIIFITF